MIRCIDDGSVVWLASFTVRRIVYWPWESGTGARLFLPDVIICKRANQAPNKLPGWKGVVRIQSEPSASSFALLSSHHKSSSVSKHLLFLSSQSPVLNSRRLIPLGTGDLRRGLFDHRHPPLFKTGVTLWLARPTFCPTPSLRMFLTPLPLPFLICSSSKLPIVRGARACTVCRAAKVDIFPLPNPLLITIH